MAISLNGTPYTGGANPQPPSKISKAVIKNGITLVAANGKRHFMTDGTEKSGWTLTWEKANATTRTAVAAVHAVDTTFPFVDEFGASHTVQCEDDERTQESAFTAADGTILEDLQLVLHQAD